MTRPSNLARRSIQAATAAIISAAPLTAQDYHFTRDIGRDGRVEIENINGRITISRARGASAEVTVHKIVKHGNGDLVKAVMEGDGDVMHVCTVYLNRDRDRNGCRGGNNNGGSRRDDLLEVEMEYDVQVPVDARVKVDLVNGNISMTGVDGIADLEVVNGSLDFEGGSASHLESVNGQVNAHIGRADWDGTLKVESVNGGVHIWLPDGTNADVRASSVNGGMHSDFPITVSRGFGAREMEGRIGRGGRTLQIETVNGGVTISRQ